MPSIGWLVDTVIITTASYMYYIMENYIGLLYNDSWLFYYFSCIHYVYYIIIMLSHDFH